MLKKLGRRENKKSTVKYVIFRTYLHCEYINVILVLRQLSFTIDLDQEARNKTRG